MVQSSGEVVALAAAFTVLQLVAVALRIQARRFKRNSLALDDYLVFAAAVSCSLTR